MYALEHPLLGADAGVLCTQRFDLVVADPAPESTGCHAMWRETKRNEH